MADDTSIKPMSLAGMVLKEHKGKNDRERRCSDPLKEIDKKHDNIYQKGRSIDGTESEHRSEARTHQSAEMNTQQERANNTQEEIDKLKLEIERLKAREPMGVEMQQQCDQLRGELNQLSAYKSQEASARIKQIENECEERCIKLHEMIGSGAASVRKWQAEAEGRTTILEKQSVQIKELEKAVSERTETNKALLATVECERASYMQTEAQLAEAKYDHQMISEQFLNLRDNFRRKIQDLQDVVGVYQDQQELPRPEMSAFPPAAVHQPASTSTPVPVRTNDTSLKKVASMLLVHNNSQHERNSELENKELEHSQKRKVEKMRREANHDGRSSLFDHYLAMPEVEGTVITYAQNQKIRSDFVKNQPVYRVQKRLGDDAADNRSTPPVEIDDGAIFLGPNMIRLGTHKVTKKNDGHSRDIPSGEPVSKKRRTQFFHKDRFINSQVQPRAIDGMDDDEIMFPVDRPRIAPPTSMVAEEEDTEIMFPIDRSRIVPTSAIEDDDMEIMFQIDRPRMVPTPSIVVDDMEIMFPINRPRMVPTSAIEDDLEIMFPIDRCRIAPDPSSNTPVMPKSHETIGTLDLPGARKGTH